MEPEQWQRVEQLFHATLQLETADRSGYLLLECSGDEALREQVESLIAASENNPAFIDTPAFSLGMRVLIRESNHSMVGKSVGPYKIVSALGKGGMGEVYLAEDTKLDRKVALKFLSPEFVGDNWAKRQLTKEAKAVAQLDHPNICQVYGMEEDQGHSFIVMQYVEGETLSDLIRAKRPGSIQVLALAKQIVSALAKAHAHGIIHRDIKPKNIMVTPSGQVKVLDFGLAKTIHQKTLDGGDDSVSHLSQNGLVPGTVAYMSPEQLRGEKLDYRSDVFSVGTLLYELICGKHPYHQGNNAELISAILTLEPRPLGQTTAEFPKGLNHVVTRCLKKERENRYQSVNEVLLDLESLQNGISVSPTVPTTLILRAAALLAVLILLVAGAAFVYSRMNRNVKTLAVLPIVCDGLDPGTRCLGPELTDSLISRLSQRADLRIKKSEVVPALYGPQAVSPQKIGQALNVDVILFGRIVPRGNSLLLQTRLENVKNGARISEDEYLLESTDTLPLQDEVSLRVSLYLQLAPGDDAKKTVALVAARQHRDPEAFELYLRGRSYWNKRDRVNIQKAIDLFRQAIDRDPVFGQAYARLADCYVVMNSVAYSSMSAKEAMTRAESAARQALEIDDMLPEAHTSLGVVQLRYHWNWAEAEKELKRAIEIDPRYAPAHYWYSHLLAVTGRKDEAIAQSEMARDLDPFSPLVLMNLARTYYRVRDYDRAIELLEKTRDEHPDNSSIPYVLGYVYFQKGMYQEAIKIFEEIATRNDGRDKWLAAAPLGYGYAKAGRRADALRILAEIEEQSKKELIPAQERAVIYMGLNDKDQAFQWLDKSYDEHFASIIYLTTDPMFDSLRSDPRFVELARKLKLPPPSDS